MVLRVLVALALFVSVAHAEDKPWAVNVPQDKQDAAFKAYDDANNLFAQGDYTKALDKYNEAIGDWDHPGIRYNRAICLINLDRPVEAFEDMTAALEYGEEPLGKDLYNQGLNYQRLLAKQVAEVEITTKDKGAKISLDGKPLVLVEGRASTMVAVNNPHEIIASKPGYETNRHPLDKLPAGKKTVIEIKLRPLEGGRWIPWAVIAAGAAVSGAGAWAYSDARTKVAQYEKAIADTCPCTSDADLGPAVKLPDQWRNREILAYSAFAIGGVTLATGVVLLVRGRGPTHFTPTVSKESAGVSFVGRW